MLKVLERAPSCAEENMGVDASLLKELDPRGPLLLHLYDWKYPAATFGYFIKPEEVISVKKSLEIGLDLARRPTGGGLIFHTHDLAFSLLIPAFHPLFSLNPLETYRNVHKIVIQAIQPLLPKNVSLSLLHEEPISPPLAYCMARPTRYDLFLNHQKVGGAAQRRTREGILHQGSIFLHFPDKEWLKPLVPPHILENFFIESTSLFPPSLDLNELRQKVKLELINVLEHL